MITARRLATATWARSLPRRFMTSRPQRFNQLQLLTRVSKTFAASESNARTIRSPHLVMPPLRSTSPEAYLLGVSPKCAPTNEDFRNRVGSSTAVR